MLKEYGDQTLAFDMLIDTTGSHVTLKSQVKEGFW